MKKPQPLTHSDWVDALKDIGVSEITDNPDALTSEELAVIWKCHQSTASTRLRKLVAVGRAQQVTRLIPNSRGAQTRIPAYLLLKEGR